MSIALTSTAFEQGEPIPREYTGDGQNISPPLQWSGPPGGTSSLALVCQDPDAPRGTFTHWVIFNLPAESRELSASVPSVGTLPGDATPGTNDFGKLDYGGPSPPPG